jgi:hypothetical protein
MYCIPSIDDYDSLDSRVKALESLLSGVKRVTASDGTEGLYIPVRVGIMTSYFMTLPTGQGAALSVSTSGDALTVYLQNEASSIKDRVVLQVNNTDPNPDGTNTSIVAVATNAPHGNHAFVAEATADDVTNAAHAVIARHINIDGSVVKEVSLP